MRERKPKQGFAILLHPDYKAQIVGAAANQYRTINGHVQHLLSSSMKRWPVLPADLAPLPAPSRGSAKIFHMRISPDLHAQLVESADACARSLAAEVRIRLMRAHEYEQQAEERLLQLESRISAVLACGQLPEADAERLSNAITRFGAEVRGEAKGFKSA